MHPRRLACVLAVMTAASALSQTVRAATYGDDAAFLQKHTELIQLTNKTGTARVALAPAWQGRVMTSSAEGEAGLSFGWINRELIASGKIQPHINVYGGEDRFWLGPEGGQFSIFFKKGAKFELSDWQTPAVIDTLGYEAVGVKPDRATFKAAFSLVNYSGTRFDVKVDRTVRLLDPGAAWKKLGVKASKDVSLVAYETENKITNNGPDAWKKDTGLLSVWILGMFNPSPATTIVVPLKPGPEAELGRKVTSDYFGAVPANRLVVKEDVAYFSGDGKYRSKIGINPRRSRAVLGSYDAANHVLTIVQFTQPAGVVDYVNSQWKLQDDPFAGDASNSYNDGPPSPGAKPLGPFYELESSSPAAALKPKGSLTHVHRTIHLSGSEAALDAVAKAQLGVTLADIAAALPK